MAAQTTSSTLNAFPPAWAGPIETGDFVTLFQFLVAYRDYFADEGSYSPEVSTRYHATMEAAKAVLSRLRTGVFLCDSFLYQVFPGKGGINVIQGIPASDLIRFKP